MIKIVERFKELIKDFNYFMLYEFEDILIIRNDEVDLFLIKKIDNEYIVYDVYIEDDISNEFLNRLMIDIEFKRIYRKKFIDYRDEKVYIRE